MARLYSRKAVSPGAPEDSRSQPPKLELPKRIDVRRPAVAVHQRVGTRGRGCKEVEIHVAVPEQEMGKLVGDDPREWRRADAHLRNPPNLDTVDSNTGGGVPGGVVLAHDAIEPTAVAGARQNEQNGEFFSQEAVVVVYVICRKVELGGGPANRFRTAVAARLAPARPVPEGGYLLSYQPRTSALSIVKSPSLFSR